MERHEKLLLEATLKDLMNELQARYPDGVMIGVVDRRNGDFTMRVCGDLACVQQLHASSRDMIQECEKEHGHGDDH
jgi:hypothetical protein